MAVDLVALGEQHVETTVRFRLDPERDHGVLELHVGGSQHDLARFRKESAAGVTLYDLRAAKFACQGVVIRFILKHIGAVVEAPLPQHRGVQHEAGAFGGIARGRSVAHAHHRERVAGAVFGKALELQRDGAVVIQQPGFSHSGAAVQDVVVGVDRGLRVNIPAERHVGRIVAGEGQPQRAGGNGVVRRTAGHRLGLAGPVPAAVNGHQLEVVLGQFREPFHGVRIQRAFDQRKQAAVQIQFVIPHVARILPAERDAVEALGFGGELVRCFGS